MKFKTSENGSVNEQMKLHKKLRSAINMEKRLKVKGHKTDMFTRQKEDLKKEIEELRRN